jgi:plasmid stabilization system protein ParE
LWSDLASADADQIERLLGERFAAFKAKRRNDRRDQRLLGLYSTAGQQGRSKPEDGRVATAGRSRSFSSFPAAANALAISLGTYRNRGRRQDAA